MAAPDKGIVGVALLGLFTVPETHDMVRTLFDPTLRKTPLDLAIVGLLAVQVGTYWWCASEHRTALFIGVYVFWRLMYNGGIGWLLYHQSHSKMMVAWGAKIGVLRGWVSKEKTEKTRRAGVLESLLAAEFSAKGLDPNTFPLEFNTWLIFRKFVDLVLMLDFTAYILLVVSCLPLNPLRPPVVEPLGLTVFRWVLGIGFILFNLWVKLDAHRIVKDYAWYWGDFFFLEEADLVFDGVFDMVPHPMYSVGYLGYYGFALLTRLYTVLLVSVFAHILQFVFLVLVENPHIDKIYGSDSELSAAKGDKALLVLLHHKPMVLLGNFQWFRALDILTVIWWTVLTYAVVIHPTYAFGLTISVKLVQAVGLCGILHRQLTTKWWTKLFLKHGYSVYDAFENFAVLYNAVLSMTYLGLVVFTAQEFLRVEYATPSPYALLRYLLAAFLVALQTGAEWLMLEEIGYYGWFYGDFFLPQLLERVLRLGIYRYLNNPERFFGVAGVWGLAIATYSPRLFVLAVLWLGTNWVLLSAVEQVHMVKLYGSAVFSDLGVSRTIKLLVPEPIRRSLPRLAQMAGRLLTDLRRQSFRDKDAQRELIKLSQEIKQESEGAVSDSEDEVAGQLLVPGYALNVVTPGPVDVGTPVVVGWDAPPNHSHDDWIGLYLVVTVGASRPTTRVALKGRWAAVSSKNSYSLDEYVANVLAIVREALLTTGSVEFAKLLLPWALGIYELRYHVGNSHRVAAILAPFEVVVPAVDVDANGADGLVSLVLLVLGKQVVATEPYAALFEGREGGRRLEVVSYLVGRLTGIEVLELVVLGSGTVEGLAKRLQDTKRVLGELK